MRLTYENIERVVRVGSSILGIDPNAIVCDIYRDRNDDAIGYCSGDHEDVQISINQDLRGNDWVEVLAHELIHAKQYLTGELEDAGQLTMYWQGNKIVMLKAIFSEEEYKLLPWEAEAFRGQHKLMEQIYERI